MNVKINFINDYNAAGHPGIIGAVQAACRNKYVGYGLDEETEKAKHLIRKLIGNDNAQVHFLTGGTQTNMIALSAFLRPYEAVIAPKPAHILVHETGAIEAAGHKILIAGEEGGKIKPEDIRAIALQHENEHMVRPKLVFISQATEYGTVYSLDELTALRGVCDELGLLLYMDGARLAPALVSVGGNASICDIARLTDAFYMGGTKNGLLFGEALVINNTDIGEDFRYYMKQRGGLLAKGFLLGIQFGYALESGLYFDIPKQANATAALLTGGLRRLGCAFAVETCTNQVFPIIKNEFIPALERDFLFEIWERINETLSCIRLVTTWDTTGEQVNAFVSRYGELAGVL